MVHKSSARLVTDGFLAITDHNYEQPVEMLHLGEKAYILVIDPDQDVSPERDKIKITVTTEPGEKKPSSLRRLFPIVAPSLDLSLLRQKSALPQRVETAKLKPSLGKGSPPPTQILDRALK